MLNVGFVVVHFHFHITNCRDHKSLSAFLLTIQESMSCSLPFSVFVWVHIFYFVVTFCGLVLDLPPLWQMRQTSVKAPRCLWNRTIDFFPASYSMFGHETHFSVFIYKDNIIKWIDVLWDVAQKPINKPSKAKLNSFLHTHWVIVSEYFLLVFKYIHLKSNRVRLDAKKWFLKQAFRHFRHHFDVGDFDLAMPFNLTVIWWGFRICSPVV